MGYKIAVVGATGAVGYELLTILAERDFPADEVVALASAKSKGREVSFGDKTLVVENLATYDFSGPDIALFSPGAKLPAEHSPRAAPAGCALIDHPPPSPSAGSRAKPASRRRGEGFVLFPAITRRAILARPCGAFLARPSTGPTVQRIRLARHGLPWCLGHRSRHSSRAPA